MNPKVSVIVPVYKAEKYIDECLESILNQDYDNLEIVLVDDGSPDECPQICDEYALKDRRIKVIHKDNSGPGFSRNVGMKACTGDFMTFVDSDDKLDGIKAVSRMVKAADKHNADVVVGCYRRFDTDYVSGINNHHLKNHEDTGTLDFRFRAFFQYGHMAFACFKLYRKSFLIKNNLEYKNYAFVEDKDFNTRVYACNPKYWFLDSSVYCYRVNINSLTSKYRDDFISAWTSIAFDFEKFLKKNNVKNNISDLSSFHVFFGSFFLAKQELQAGKGICETADIIKKYMEIPGVRKLMKDIISQKYTKGIRTRSWKWVIWGSTLLVNIRLYLLFTMGIALLRKLSIDEQITKRRYKKRNK